MNIVAEMHGNRERRGDVQPQGDQPIASEHSSKLMARADEHVPRLRALDRLRLGLISEAELAVVADLSLSTGEPGPSAYPAFFGAAREVQLSAAPQPFFSASRSRPAA